MTETAAAEAAENPSRGTDRSLWHNPDFLKFWVGESASLLGTQVTVLAVPLTAIYALHSTDQEVGLLRFVQLVPYILLSLIFGVLVDRVRRREVMIWSNVARMILIALIPTLYWLGGLNMALLLVITCVAGIASVLFDLCWMAYVPTLVRDPKHYVEAQAKMGISSSTAEVAGPGLAGLLVGALTAPFALLVDAGSYAVSLVALMMIRTKEKKPARPARRHLPTELKDGLRWVFHNRILRWLALIGFCCNFSMNTVWTMFLLHGTRDLHMPSQTIGGIFATASVGGLIGAMLSRRVIGWFPLGPTYLIAQSGLLLGPALIVFAAGPSWLRIGMFVLSFFTTYLGLGIANVIIVSLRQTTTPQSMMGRMTACFRMLLFGGGALGGLCAGLLSGWLGAWHALIVASVASGAVVVGLILSPVSRLRELPPPVLEAA
ncbi:MAG: MFS transporter [Actinomycetota bacterium]|nr:MFS transporter [Actinomycetota bacterium]